MFFPNCSIDYRYFRNFPMQKGVDRMINPEP